MMESEGHMINQLIARHLQGEDLAENERNILESWLSDPDNKKFYGDIADEDKLLKRLEDYHYFQSAVNEGIQKFEELGGGIKVRSLKLSNSWRRYVVAASVIFVLASGAYVWFNSGKTDAGPPDQGSKEIAIIPAGKDGATLTLADGKQVVLDDLADGAVAKQGASEVNKDGSVLRYMAGGTEVVYNVLSTERGRQFQLELPDGSRLWLNAASSVRFPSAFPGKDRRIEITGECYLEISKDASKPFIVSVGDMDIEVLGTSFNINAYPEESSIKTTLVEGKVKIRKGSETLYLKPGQQAQINGESINLVENADVDAALAWKNGLISLGGVDSKSLFNAISRWYDVDVEVEGEIPSDVFYGNIPRSLSLQDVAKALGNMTSLKYMIEGKKMIVSK